jgi:hypothetical protein
MAAKELLTQGTSVYFLVEMNMVGSWESCWVIYSIADAMN